MKNARVLMVVVVLFLFSLTAIAVAQQGESVANDGVRDVPDGDCDGNGIDDVIDTMVAFSFQHFLSLGGPAHGAVDFDADGDLDILRSNDWLENLDGMADFGPPREVQGSLPGDVDRDGDIDVVGGTADATFWKENLDGLGNFGPRIEFAAPYFLFALADFDGDLDPDILAADGDHNRVLWIENFGGAFGPPNTMGAALLPSSGVPADLDGDGDVDAAVYSRGDGKLAWFENLDGAGDFASSQEIATLSTTPYAGLSAFDFNGDDRIDLFLSQRSSPHTVLWFENLGSGLFGSAQTVGSLFNAQELTGFDLDVDGDADLVVVESNDINWYENLDGLGTIGPLQSIAELFPAGDIRIHPADLNGDATVDLLSSYSIIDFYYEDKYTVWLENQANDCDGNQRPDICDVAEVDCNANGVPDPCEPDCNANGVPDSCDISAGTSEDCTGNGTPDECESDCDGNGVADRCEVLAGAADCNLNGLPDSCEDLLDCNDNAYPDVCDVFEGESDDCDGDRIPDECEADCNGDGIPDDCEPDCNANGIPDSCDPEPDCNANGIPDSCDVDEGTSHDCNETGVPDECEDDCDLNGIADTCDVAVGFATHPFDSHEAANLDPADIDGDGDPDLLVGSSASGDARWYSNDDGSFSVGGSLGSDTLILAADIDGDGDLDAVGGSTIDDRLVWYENVDGLGSFGAPTTISTAADEVGQIAAADLDSDGDVDLVAGLLGSTLAGTAVYWNLDGAGSFSSEQILASPCEAAVLALADLDLDGRTDVLEACTTGELRGRRNTGGAFDAPTTIDTVVGGLDVGRIVAGDLDGDRWPDFVFTSYLLSTGAGDTNWYPSGAQGSAFGPSRLINSSAQSDLELFDPDSDGDLDLAQRGGWFENLDGAGTFSYGGSYPFARSIAIADVDDDGSSDLYYVLDAVGWRENLSSDCNANGIPDACEPDCNGTGFPDACDIRDGRSIDCDASGTPDECEVACPGCDVDGDECVDELDAFPNDPFLCADVDGDSCDDCASGQVDAATDGADPDHDGICDLGDCLDNDPQNWRPPSAARFLQLVGDDDVIALSWTAPEDPGGLALLYDTLRSTSGSDFSAPTAACVETSGAGTTASDVTPSSVGEIRFYLIRPLNACAEGGPLGTDSFGNERVGRSCP